MLCVLTVHRNELLAAAASMFSVLSEAIGATANNSAMIEYVITAASFES